MAKRKVRFRVTATVDVAVEADTAEAALEHIRQLCIAGKVPVKDMKVKEDRRVPKPKGDPAVTKTKGQHLEPLPKKAPKVRKGPQLGLGFK